MATDSVKLLIVRASPYAMRAILALEAKGVKYELIEENLSAKSQLLLESNPVYKKIPVLLHGGKAIPESLFIVLYVDEAWPERAAFFPKDPYARAMTHFWGDFIDKKIFQLAVSTMKTKKGDPKKEAGVSELYENFLTLESGFTQLDAKPFFNGAGIGYADICLAPLAAWLRVFVELAGIRVPTAEEAPKLHKFLSAIREHPATKVAFPDPDELLSYVVLHLKKTMAA
ncbi:hypothetical protein O6H91_02G145000 [Diphasiastrum complanatum]|uniref:Uncharacterized protein n=2 Tax=Diphasiastrum complanatum TaxID=34168 RepID=A0ACC2ELY3_DIPCM|nr:hypothetical protein O6H91_02G145000 [Diphasiastrum complanatum]KAJ7567393.1 hypothetical protein O6H91_02G145000 [Diphasiastrum complanatum]